MIKSILAVCVGNICRSPMAEAILQHKVADIAVSSAGISALIGHPADTTSRILMHENGIDISSHVARQITDELCRKNDLILVMERNHKTFIEEKFPFTRGKVFLLCHKDLIDIPDPYQQDRSAFQFSLKLIENGVSEWQKKLSSL